MSPDPLGGNIADPQSQNRYAYALNNPETLTDPLGLDSCSSYNGNCSGEYSGGVTYTLDGITVPASTAIGALQSGFALPSALAGTNAQLISSSGGNFQYSFPVQIGTETVGLNGSPIGEQPIYGTGLMNLSLAGAAFAPDGQSGGSPSWLGTFANSFVSNFPKTTWSSIANDKGCINQFSRNTLGNLNPFTPSASSIAEPAASFINSVKFNSALAYAASQPNVLGGTGLLYPFKSSVFRTVLRAGSDALEVVPVAQLDLAMGQALYTEYEAANVGGCQ